MISKLQIVSATRCRPDAFQRTCRLGASLPSLMFDRRIKAAISCDNKRGLPKVYNEALATAADDDVLLFIHDDIFINDLFILARLEEALATYDVIGLAGNINPDAHQVGWAFWRNGGEKYWYEEELLSGAVAHTEREGVVMNVYGPAPQECALLDGCFLAVKAGSLREKQIQFDEAFTFNFYDIDFCQACREKGLRLGTWPIAVTHDSIGRFDTTEWEQALSLYRRKWAHVLDSLEKPSRRTR